MSAGNWLRIKVLSEVWGYGLAISTSALALAIAAPIDAPSSCFFLAITVSALYGGKGPAILSVVLSALAFDYFFLLPQHHLAIQPSEYPRFVAFLGAAGLIAVLIEMKRRAEESRLQLHARYQAIADAAPDAIVSIDENNRIQLVNPAATKIFGWAAADLVGQPLTILLPNFRVAERTTGAEWTGRRSDGTEFSAEVSFREVASGGRKHFTGFIRDVTDRKRAEAALQKSESYLAQAQKLSKTGSLGFNTSTGELFWSQETFRLVGLDSAVKPSLDLLFERVHPEDRARVKEQLDLVSQSGADIDLEHRFLLPEGSVKHVRVLARAVSGESGGFQYLGAVMDVTPQVQAEEALRASERDFSLIIETMPALVWCAAPNGELIYVNQRVLDYTGTTLDSLAKSGWVDYLHPDDVAHTVYAWSIAVTTSRLHEVQYRLRRFDGAYRWFHVLGQLGRDKDGQMTRWYGLLIDIDERKNTEEALRRTQAKLSRASQLAAVSELSASIAHEVNQPLSAVVANGHACLRWLLAQPPNLAKAQEAAERIVRDGKDAGEVVRRVRTLFKRAANERIPLDLNDVIGEVLHLLRGETARKGVAVETSLENDLPPVVADRVQLQQLLLNLLNNGLDAMDSVLDRPKKLSIYSKRQCPESVLVEIRDYGAGLTNPDRIFEAFFTTKENGMGMGLAICRSIIEAHEGRLWASSQEVPGTTFSFTLPVKRTS